MSQKPPTFLIKSEEEPRIIQRLYNGRKMIVFEGHAKYSAIKGWVENPRIDVARKMRQSQVGNRMLTQDEVFDLMKMDKEFHLKALRDDILKNGLREPIVLTYDGKLLDGNRRFFAIKYAVEGMTPSDKKKADFEKVPCYVLMQDASEDDVRHVLVEENFAASLKLEWPDYVKAKHVKTDSDASMSIDDIAAKYGWDRSKIKETLRIWEIIDDFLSFATSAPDKQDESGGGLGLAEVEAESCAAKNYQFFNEAKKSFFNEIKSDYPFKVQFFRWIHEGKFSSFAEVRIAYQAWKHPEAKPVLMGPEPTAAKEAKAIIDYNQRVVRGREELSARIDSIVTFLKGVKADQIATLSTETLDKLAEAVKLLEHLGRAAIDHKSKTSRSKKKK
jgi:hypothetical protein